MFFDFSKTRPKSSAGLAVTSYHGNDVAPSFQSPLEQFWSPQGHRRHRHGCSPRRSAGHFAATWSYTLSRRHLVSHCAPARAATSSGHARSTSRPKRPRVRGRRRQHRSPLKIPKPSSPDAPTHGARGATFSKKAEPAGVAVAAFREIRPKIAQLDTFRNV